MKLSRSLLASLLVLTVYNQSFAIESFCRALFKADVKVSSSLRWNQFEIGRGLSEYETSFHPDFKLRLKTLGPNETWIDLGSGKGNAGLDYLKSFPDLKESPRVFMVTYNLGRIFSSHLKNERKWQNKLKIFEGRLWEDIPLKEIPKAMLMTDLFGVLSYTRDLTTSLQKVFDVLEMGGELYIHSLNYATTIEVDGKNLSLTQFLKFIPGLEVEGTFATLKIMKNKPTIHVPKLKLTQIDETQKPFFRRFQVDSE